MSEMWKPIPGYADRYEVSSEGRVRSISGMRGSREKPYYIKGFVDKIGYVRIVLYYNRRRVSHGLHVLVARAFLGMPPEGCEVNHIDLNKSNNRIDNLEYVTKKENQQHARANRSWAKNPWSISRRKLTPDQVLEISASSEPDRVLAKRYSVSNVTIRNIRFGRTYRDVLSPYGR